MDLGLAGRKAFVCAPSRGRGRGCATALAAEGVEVVINGRNAAHLEQVADEIRKATGATARVRLVGSRFRCHAASWLIPTAGRTKQGGARLR